MRLLLADSPVTDAPTLGSGREDAALAAAYAVPRTSRRWLRANFACSVDGSVTGANGQSGSINTEADHIVFELLRALSDVVVVGAGTARQEGYPALTVDDRWRAARADAGLSPALPLVVVSARGQVPPRLVEAEGGTVLLVTHGGSEGLDSAREQLGTEHVLVCGQGHVDLVGLMDELAERGWTRALTEGGPRLLGSFLAAGLVDELCLSVTPRVVVGDGPRISTGDGRDDAFTPRVLVEQDGTLMGRWLRA